VTTILAPPLLRYAFRSEIPTRPDVEPEPAEKVGL